MSVDSQFNFSVALDELKKGSFVSREAWGENIKAHLQVPDENSKMSKPYIYMVKVIKDGGLTVSQDVFPLDLSCESIMADDWYIVE